MSEKTIQKQKEPKEVKNAKENKENKDNTEAKELKEVNENKNAILTYKGKPLVRKDNVICFGDAAADKYVLTLEIRKTKNEKGLEIATNVLILIQSSDAGSQEIAKFGEKDSLYEAFEIGEIWLDSLLKQG